MSDFQDLLRANADRARDAPERDLPARAGRGIGVVTCMDPRIDPLEVLGLQVGDAVVLRNAGARVSDAVLRELALASHLLGVERVLVIAHTGCRMASATDEQVHAQIAQESGTDTRSLVFDTIADQDAALAVDVQRVRSWPYLKAGTTTGGFVYDVATGRLEQRVG